VATTPGNHQGQVNMTTASHASLFMARFDEMRTFGELGVANLPGMLFRQMGADTRAAATEPGSQQAYRFLVLALHADEAAANWSLDNRSAVAPFFEDAVEVWGAVLKPFRHLGECNYLNAGAPGPLFATSESMVDPTEPIAIVTTVGWIVGENLDMNRVQQFSTGVLGVRASMTGTEGLHSQQSFFFPGVLKHDPVTVSLWRNFAAARTFAYGPGVHRDQMLRLREKNLADRTSFTRFHIQRAEGTWHGRNPLER
jgi:hypothetical protein